MPSSSKTEAVAGWPHGLHIELTVVRDGLEPLNLSSAEAQQYKRIASQTRRRSWLMGRRAVRKVLATPRLSQGAAGGAPLISLAYSGDCAVAAGTVSEAVIGLGVDLELEAGPAAAGERFFLTDGEIAWLALQPAPLRTRQRLRLWTLKEALFKADPENESGWLRDYEVLRPHRTTSRAATLRGGCKIDFLCSSVALAGGFLSVAVAAEERETHGFTTH